MSHAAAPELVTQESHSGPCIARAKGHDIIECEICGFKHALPLPDPAALARVTLRTVRLV